MAKAITTLSGPENAIHRLMLQIELLKVFGALRSDDSRWIQIRSLQVDLSARVITGLCTKTKGSQKTAGRVINGMPFRVPLLASLWSTGWWRGFEEDVLALGIPAGADYVIPMSPLAVGAGLVPGLADNATAFRHLRRALSAAQLPPEVIDNVEPHSAKRTSASWVQEYIGEAELSPGAARFAFAPLCNGQGAHGRSL